MLAAREVPSVHGRRGTTLQEMLVVLAILVSLVGSGWPAISGGLGKSHLRSGAKEVRSELAKARLTAIEQGVPYQFRYHIVSGHFAGAPLSAVHEDEAGFTPVQDVKMDTADNDDAEELPVFELELPEGVVFSAKCDGDADGLAVAEFKEPATVEREINLPGSDDADWSAPIVFFPNGRTSDAQLTLHNEDGHRIVVTLRGLTGSATVGDVKKVEVEK